MKGFFKFECTASEIPLALLCSFEKIALKLTKSFALDSIRQK